jgi:hypothetical protein
MSNLVSQNVDLLAMSHGYIFCVNEVCGPFIGVGVAATIVKRDHSLSV